MENDKNEHSTLPDRPLVTFALIAYNQEEYIQKAIEGAFLQTYSPLEIIISDDCSTDSTFQIMQAMAAEYQGTHRIILNRNMENLGIGGHVNLIDSKATGKLIVHAAGDDISMPTRVERLVAAWSSDKPPSALRSNGIYIDKNGNIIDEYCVDPNLPSLLLEKKDWQLDALGFSLAFDRRLLDIFGPFDPRIFQEDTVISTRALMTNGIQYLNEPLVLYRRHNSVSNLVTNSKYDFLEHHKKWALCRIHRHGQLKRDHARIGLIFEDHESSSRMHNYNIRLLAVLTKPIHLACIAALLHLFENRKQGRDLMWFLFVRLGIRKVH